MAFFLATGIEWKDIRATKAAPAKAKASEEVVIEKGSDVDRPVSRKEEV